MRSGVALAVVLAGLLIVPTDAQSQGEGGGGYAGRARRATARTITASRPVEGRLTSSDPVFGDESHFQVWKFASRAGQDVSITLTSREFDAFLMLVAAAGSTEQPLQMAIGDTATRAAQLAFRIPADGEYLIVVNTQAARATGRYQLSLLNSAVAAATGSITPLSRISAADATAITLGSARDGELTAENAQLGDSSRFNAWRFDGRAGQRIVIDQTSSEFDSYLLLLQQTPSGPRVLRENDDTPATGSTPGSENSQIAVELPESGTYLIVATSFRPNTTGRYRIALRTMEEACAAGGPCEPTAAPARRTFFGNVATAASPAIALGDTVRARLGSRDGSIGDGTRFRAYRFLGRADDEVAIFLEARAPDATRFDPFLHLLRAAGDSLGALKSDDDGAGQRNSLITARLPASGEYFIVANGLTVADTGNFTLTVLSLAEACRTRRICAVGEDLRNIAPERAVAAVPAERIALGSTVTGRFDPGAARLPDGKPIAPWRYTARARERVVISNRSDDFDAYLLVYALRGDSVVEVARDDDGAGGLDAQIALEFAQGGDYLIVAGSFDATATGDYRLTLESMAAACAAGGPCEPGETAAATARLLPALAAPHRELPARGSLQSELPASASRLPGGSRFQSYRFQGRAGERIVLSMESARFDTYLHLAQIRGSGLRLIGSNDDGGTGSDARLVATLPVTGEYLVIASALGGTDSSGFGEYRISRASCDSACAAYRDVPGTRSTGVYEPVLRAPRRTLPRSGTVEAALGADDATLTDGTKFHAYWITARRGSTLRAAIHSGDFDPFVVLMRVERGSFTIVDADDDGGEGTDALLEWPVERSGAYVVVVTAYSDDKVGGYSLMVQSGPASASEPFRIAAAAVSLRPLLAQALASASRPVAIGQTLSAEFASDAPQLVGRGRFQAFRFSGRAQTSIEVTMTAAQFDTYLYLAQVENGVARLLGSDDDGGDGTNSRITALLPADGEYLVIAAEYEASTPSARAAFTISVKPCDAACAADSTGVVGTLLSSALSASYNLPDVLHPSPRIDDHGDQALRSAQSGTPRPRRLRKGSGP